MWYAKMYFSEKKEVFQFDSHGVQGVPSTYKETPVPGEPVVFSGDGL